MKQIYLLLLLSLFSLNSNFLSGQIATFNCSLDASSPTYNRIYLSGGTPTLSSAGSNVHYQLYQISPSITGSYSFPTTYPGDAVMTIYTSPFDPTDATINVHAYNDDGNGGSDPLIITDLDAGACYTIVASSYGNGSTGAYDFEVLGPAGATLTDTGCAGFGGIQECVDEIPAVPINVNISDPCACGNALNILDGTGEVTLFHEEVTITAGTGQTWELTSLNSGDALDAAGVALPLPLALTETPAGSGTYVVEFWHTPGTGYDANFSNGTAADDQTMSNSCSGPCLTAAADIPTMSQWGLMILGLLFLTFSSLFVMQKEGSLQFVNTNTSSGTQFIDMKQLPFNKALYAKLLVGILLGFIALFSLATQAFGYEMTTADLPGSMIFSAIFAYFASLFFIENE
jgi:hypothetical protein